MTPEVLIIILNYNGTADTLECLESVYRLQYKNFKVCLVDNASGDKSWNEATKRFPDLRVLENSQNLGYAGGNNVGLRVAIKEGFPYALVLNNDTVVAENALDRLVCLAEANDEATIIAPTILSYYDRNKIDSCGTQMDWFRLRPRLGYYGKPAAEAAYSAHSGDIFPGSALLLKIRTLGDKALFDENFFLIHEDADLCLKNLRRGFRNLHSPEAIVYHKVSSALGALPLASAYYSVRNFLYLAERERMLAHRTQCLLGVLTMSVANAAYLFMGNRDKKTRARAFFLGVRDYLRRVNGPLRETS